MRNKVQLLGRVYSGFNPKPSPLGSYYNPKAHVVKTVCLSLDSCSLLGSLQYTDFLLYLMPVHS